jgi:hypothetical protein
MDETPLGKELPEGGGAGVAQHRLRAAGEHCRRPSAFLAEAQVTHGVKTAMKRMQTLGGDAARHTPAMNAGSLELRQ